MDSASNITPDCLADTMPAAEAHPDPARAAALAAFRQVVQAQGIAWLRGAVAATGGRWPFSDWTTAELEATARATGA